MKYYNQDTTSALTFTRTSNEHLRIGQRSYQSRPDAL